MSNSGRRVRSRGLVAIGAAVSLAIYMAVIAVPASAATTCVVTGVSPNQVMTVTLAADTDTATLVVNGANIDVNAGACVPVATTAGVSSIVVNADTLAQVEAQTVTVNGAGGSFTASIAINMGAGDDTVSANNTGGDAITADLGDGNDTSTAPLRTAR